MLLKLLEHVAVAAVAVVAGAVEAATYAPNHKRTEPWRFHLLGPAAARRVCELNAELVAASKGEAAGAKKLERWLRMPGWLVVTCVGGGGGASLDDPAGAAREDYAACCCAVQNLCLSLHADGLGISSRGNLHGSSFLGLDGREALSIGRPMHGILGRKERRAFVHLGGCE